MHCARARFPASWRSTAFLFSLFVLLCIVCITGEPWSGDGAENIVESGSSRIKRRHERRLDAVSGHDSFHSRCDGVANVALAVPLLGNCDKARALDSFWRRTGAISYWHVQRTGGATMCAAAVALKLYTDAFMEGYAVPEPGGAMNKGRSAALSQLRFDTCQFGYLNETMCNSFGFYDKRVYKPCRLHAVAHSTWELQVPMGRHFFSSQPAAHDDWPYQWFYNDFWRDGMAAASDGSSLRHPFWTRWVHILTIRDPVERFLSDLRRRHFFESCRTAGLAFGGCVDRMLAAPEKLERLFFSRGMNGFLLMYNVKHRLLANQMVMHLSGPAHDVAVAVAALDGMSAVLDLGARPEASRFILRRLLYPDDAAASAAGADAVLSRALTPPMAEKPAGPVGSAAVFREQLPELYARVRERLAGDYEVWERGIRLLDEHARRLGFRPEQEKEGSSAVAAATAGGGGGDGDGHGGGGGVTQEPP
ncbi:unnamed protein product [Phaeothamnion confervicola]